MCAFWYQYGVCNNCMQHGVLADKGVEELFGSASGIEELTQAMLHTAGNLAFLSQVSFHSILITA